MLLIDFCSLHRKWGKSHEFLWKLIVNPGKDLVLSGEGYKTKTICKNGIASVINNASSAEIVEASPLYTVHLLHKKIYGVPGKKVHPYVQSLRVANGKKAQTPCYIYSRFLLSILVLNGGSFISEIRDSLETLNEPAGILKDTFYKIVHENNHPPDDFAHSFARSQAAPARSLYSLASILFSSRRLFLHFSLKNELNEPAGIRTQMNMSPNHYI